MWVVVLVGVPLALCVVGAVILDNMHTVWVQQRQELALMAQRIVRNMQCREAIYTAAREAEWELDAADKRTLDRLEEHR